MLNPPARGALIGDDIRDKWLGFLARALELGYITVPEFNERSEIVLTARTSEDILPALRDFPKSDTDAWSAQWKPRLPALFAPPSPAKQDVPMGSVILAPPRRTFIQVLPQVMWALVVIMLVLAICIELAR